MLGSLKAATTSEDKFMRLMAMACCALGVAAAWTARAGAGTEGLYHPRTECEHRADCNGPAQERARDESVGRRSAARAGSQRRGAEVVLQMVWAGYTAAISDAQLQDRVGSRSGVMGQFDFSVVMTGEFPTWLVSGLLLSLQLLAASWLLAVPLATVVALCRLSSVGVLRGFGAVFVEGIRNVPLLVHMLFWYFAMPELL